MEVVVIVVVAVAVLAVYWLTDINSHTHTLTPAYSHCAPSSYEPHKLYVG